MMGNHDRRKKSSQVFSSVIFDPDGFFQSTFSINSYELLLLDTLLECETASKKHEGLLCESRLGCWTRNRQLQTKKSNKFYALSYIPRMFLGYGSDKIN